MTLIGKIRQVLQVSLNGEARFDDVSINQGRILSSLNETKTSKTLKDFEFKVFSQWGEDGIIQHLTRTVDIKNKTFIEFGVEDFFESNCRFLMMKDDWRGFVIDGSRENIARLKKSNFYWKHHLDAVDAFITKDNINALLAKSGFDADLGILSVDLDGNDYYVLEAIENFRPRILICEYNPIFGATRKISVPYSTNFQRSAAHSSNLYWGASLGAMTHIADIKGYALVGTNTASTNAFYVRKELVNSKIEVLSVEAAYSPSNYRDSRDENGALTFVGGADRFELIKGLPVFDVERSVVEPL
jgi:hypothetical protein